MIGDEVQTYSSEHAMSLPQIEIRPLQAGEDATAFRTLNEEWITRYFTLEKADRETLGDPENKILKKGGYVFMAYLGHQAVGCVALIPIGDGIYELSKMAVSPREARTWNRPQAAAACGTRQSGSGRGLCSWVAIPGWRTRCICMSRSAFAMCLQIACPRCRMCGRMCLWNCHSDLPINFFAGSANRGQ